MVILGDTMSGLFGQDVRVRQKPHFPRPKNPTSYSMPRGNFLPTLQFLCESERSMPEVSLVHKIRFAHVLMWLAPSG